MTAKNTLNFSFKRVHFKNGTVNFFLFHNFDKQNKMQLLAKFKKIPYRVFRATLNFRKIFLKYERLKLKLRVFLAGHIIFQKEFSTI